MGMCPLTLYLYSYHPNFKIGHLVGTVCMSDLETWNSWTETACD